MVLNLVRKEGIRALAYAVNDVSALSTCSLKIVCSDAQFALSLEHSVAVPGIDGEQLFTLRYEGANLVPGETSLGNVGIPLSDESLHAIARHGQPRPRTLTLTLKAPCSLWYPRSLGNRMPSLEMRSPNLWTLARATQICVVFDTKWLGDNLALLQRAIEGSRQLTGVPVIPQFARVYQQADWPILNLDQDAKFGPCHPSEKPASEAVPSIEYAVADPPPIEGVVHDAPPPYTHVSSKRSRRARVSLTPDSPPPKRLLQDPTRVLSPTKRATSPSSVSPKSTASSTATVQVDVFQDIVTSAVEKVLPDLLRTQLPSILQDILPGMLASPSPSPCLSPTPRPRKVANALTEQPRSNHSTTPAALVRAVVNTYTETHLQKILNNALDQASQQATELYNSAGVELEDYIVDSKLELATLKEDHIAAFNDECNEKLVEFKERLVEEKDETEVEIKAHADEVVLKTWDRLNLVENACCNCKCPHGAKDRRSQLERGRRAMSLPL